MKITKFTIVEVVPETDKPPVVHSFTVEGSVGCDLADWIVNTLAAVSGFAQLVAHYSDGSWVSLAEKRRGR